MAGFTLMFESNLSKKVNCKATAELRLEPSGLWRHDIAAVGNIHKLLH